MKPLKFLICLLALSVSVQAQTLRTNVGDISPQTSSGLGSSVAIAGTIAAVGAPEGFIGVNCRGTQFVQIYEKGTTWDPTVAIRQPENSAYLGFGTSVSLSGNVLAVGSPAGKYFLGTSNYPARGTDPGKVYLFTKSGANWTHTRTITGTNPSFGLKVSFDGPTPSGNRFLAIGGGTENQYGSPTSSEIYVHELAADLSTVSSTLLPLGAGASSASYLRRRSRNFSFDGEWLVCSSHATYTLTIYRRVGSTWALHQNLNSDGADQVAVSRSGFIVAKGFMNLPTGDVGTAVHFYTRGPDNQFSLASSFQSPGVFSDPAITATQREYFGLEVAASGNFWAAATLEPTISANIWRSRVFLFQWNSSTQTSSYLGNYAGPIYATSSSAKLSMLTRDLTPGAMSLSADSLWLTSPGEGGTAFANGVGNALILTKAGSVWSSNSVLGLASTVPNYFDGPLEALDPPSSGYVERFLVMCSPSDDEGNDGGAATDSGAVYILMRERADEKDSGEAWISGWKIKLPAAAAGDNFGKSITGTGIGIAAGNIGNKCLIGATGRAGKGQVWMLDLASLYTTLTFPLLTGLPVPGFVGSGAKLGSSLAHYSWGGITHVLAGAPEDSAAGALSGRVVYYSQLMGESWVAENLPLPTQVDSIDYFGFSVEWALEPGFGSLLAVVGSPLDEDGGAVYTIRQDSPGWVQRSRHTDANQVGAFGYSLISLPQGGVGVGSYPLDLVGGGIGRGGASILSLNSGPPVALPLPASLSSSAGAGFTLGYAEGSLLVGAPGDDTGIYTNRGSVLIFSPPATSGGAWTFKEQQYGPAEAQAAYGSQLSHSMMAMGGPGIDVGGRSLGGVRILRASAYELWAVSMGLDSLTFASSDDPDRDGASNFLEFCMGTNPRSAASAPRLTTSVVDGRMGASYVAPTYNTTGVIPTWESGTGLNYIDSQASGSSFVPRFGSGSSATSARFAQSVSTLPRAFLRLRFNYFPP